MTRPGYPGNLLEKKEVLPMSADREVLLTCPEVERLCRLSRSTIYKTIRDGTFPAPVKISARPCGRMIAPLPLLLSDAMRCKRKA